MNPNYTASLLIALCSIFMAGSQLINKPNNFTVVQWNVRGQVNTRTIDLQNTLGFDPDILAIQETLLNKETIIARELTEKYDIVRHGEGTKHTKKKERDFSKRGIITCIKKCHPHRTHLKHDDKFGTLIITEIYIHGKQRLNIANAYIKHQNGQSSREVERNGIRKLLENPLHNMDDIILVGDFNCHNILWGSSYNCHKGELLADIIHNNNMIVENRGHYTHINQHTENTCIDITISKVKSNIGNHTWETLDPHGSDHLPVLSTWGPNINHNEIEVGKIRFKTEKADWEKYHELWKGVQLEDVRHENITIYKKKLEQKFKDIAKQSIPFKENTHNQQEREGRKQKKRREQEWRTVPWWEDAIDIAKDERLMALRRWEDTGCPEDWKRYKKLRNKTTNIIREKRAACLERNLEAINSDTSGSQVWNIIKSMDGTKATGKTNIAPLIDRLGNEAQTDIEKANTIGTNLQFNSSDNNYTDKFRQFKQNHIKSNNHLLEKKHTNTNSEPYNHKITIQELESTINKKGNSSPGEDSLQYPMFKHLPQNALDILLHFFNQIWETGEIPPDFKHAIVIPIYKTDKPINDPSSYRPIALTDHIGKILESIVTNRLNAHLEEQGVIKSSQSGFRGKRQTLDHIARIVHTAQYCNDREKITGAVFLDLEKAYDLLWREGCLEEIHKIGVSGRLYNYILTFLQNRTFQVKINNTLSDTYIQQNGVPQGAVISPTLFNILINSIANLEDKFPAISLAQYADDLAIYIKFNHAIKKDKNISNNRKKSKTHPNYKSRIKLHQEKAIKTLETPTNELISQLQSRGFKVNVTKTQCILFGTKCSDDQYITIDNRKVKVTKTVTYLGVTIDYRLLFREHITSLVAKGEKALQIVKHLSGKRWGLKAKVLKMLYLSYVLPKMTYGEEMFTVPSIKGSPTSGIAAKKLDVVQNAALATITRCCRTSPSLALSVLTGVPPLAIRRKEKQINLWARFQHNPDNPARHIYKDKWEAKRQFKKGFETGIVKNTQDLLKEINLNETMITKKILTRDHWNLPLVDIDISLSKNIDKSTTLAKHCKEITLKHINTKYIDRKHIYTDGSKEGERTGAGFFVENINIGQSFRLNDNLAITSAELVAIEKALEHALGDGDRSGLLICTDSLGACMAVQGGVTGGSRPDLVMKIIELAWDISMARRPLTICWIPAHVDIAGNESADNFAKIGKNKTEIDTDVKLGYTEIKAISRKYIKNTIFQRMWDSHTGNSIQTIRSFVPHVQNNFELDNWRINRMRVLRPKFTFTHNDAWCRRCRLPIDVHHVLISCTYFDRERDSVDRILRINNKKLEIASILAPSKDHQLMCAINRMLVSIDKIFGI